MTGLSDERLAGIAAAVESATPGPWSAADEHGLIEGATPAWCISRMRPGFELMDESAEDEDGRLGGYLYDVAEIVHEDEHMVADAEFIALTRSAVPELLAEVARQRISIARALSVATNTTLTPGEQLVAARVELRAALNGADR